MLVVMNFMLVVKICIVSYVNKQYWLTIFDSVHNISLNHPMSCVIMHTKAKLSFREVTGLSKDTGSDSKPLRNSN